MHVPLRILRAEADEIDPTQRHLSMREQERHTRIFDTAQSLLARYGRHAFTFTGLAAALRMAPATLRRHVADLDELQAQLMERHIQAIARKLGEIRPDAPDPHASRRAAYLAFTRKPFGGFTEPHLLLIRDRHTLPPDLQVHIETLYSGLATLLAGAAGPGVMDLLDAPTLTPADILALLPVLLGRLQPEPAREPKEAVKPPPREAKPPAERRYERPRLVTANFEMMPPALAGPRG